MLIPSRFARCKIAGLSFAMAILYSFCLSWNAALAAPTEKALKLYQKHYFYGTNELTIAADGMRLVNTGTLKFVVVARAPEWKINIYRPDEKIYFSESLSQLSDTGLVSNFLVGKRSRLPDRGPYRRSDFDFCGLKAVRLTAARETFKYLPLDRALNAPRQVEAAIYAIYKMPTNGGITLAFDAVSEHNDFLSGTNTIGSREQFISTSKIESLSVSPDIFNLPPGYKKADSVRTVVTGETGRRQSEEALETFGRGVGIPRK